MSDKPKNLPDALLKERDRVRDVIKPAYEEIGRAGAFALGLTINPALERAEEAITSFDVVLMVKSLAELRDITD